MLKSERRMVESLTRQLRKTAGRLERIGLQEYVAYLGKPRKIWLQNFIAGIARGFGMAIGFSLLSALVVILLQRLAAANIPWLASFLAEIVEATERYMH